MRPAKLDELDAIFQAREYEGLVSLSAALCGSNLFDGKGATWGLPSPLFLFVEGLLWFAQGIRSGTWTYFEATPPARQQAMLEALRQEGMPPDFAERYALGMRNWETPDALDALDAWLDDNDWLNKDLLWALASRHRTSIESVIRAEEQH